MATADPPADTSAIINSTTPGNTTLTGQTTTQTARPSIFNKMRRSSRAPPTQNTTIPDIPQSITHNGITYFPAYPNQIAGPTTNANTTQQIQSQTRPTYSNYNTASRTHDARWLGTFGAGLTIASLCSQLASGGSVLGMMSTVGGVAACSLASYIGGQARGYDMGYAEGDEDGHAAGYAQKSKSWFSRKER